MKSPQTKGIIDLINARILRNVMKKNVVITPMQITLRGVGIQTNRAYNAAIMV